MVGEMANAEFKPEFGSEHEGGKLRTVLKVVHDGLGYRRR